MNKSNRREILLWILAAAAILVGVLTVTAKAQSGLGNLWGDQAWVYDASNDQAGFYFYCTSPADKICASLTYVRSASAMVVYNGTTPTSGSDTQITFQTTNYPVTGGVSDALTIDANTVHVPFYAVFEQTFSAWGGGSYFDGISIDDTDASGGGKAISIQDSTPTENGYWNHDGSLVAKGITASGTSTFNGTARFVSLDYLGNLTADAAISHGTVTSTSAGQAIPCTGSITAISANLAIVAETTAGPFDVNATVNGSAVYGIQLTSSGTGWLSGYGTQARGTDTVSAGNIVRAELDFDPPAGCTPASDCFVGTIGSPQVIVEVICD